MNPLSSHTMQRFSIARVAATGCVCLTSLLVASNLAACAGADATLLVTSSSSGVALSGFPYTPPDEDEADDVEPEEVALEDGWVITFSRVVVVSGGMQVGSDSDVKVELASQYAVDLTANDPIEIKRVAGDAGTELPLSFQTLPVSGETLGVNVSEADMAVLEDAGATVFINGEATKGSQARRIELLLPASATYTNCTNGLNGANGLKLVAGAITKAEVTFDAGAFMRSSLDPAATGMRFEALAAAAGVDGVLTFDELASQDLAALVGIDGNPLLDEEGNALSYDLAGETGSTLQDFVLHAVRRGLTINGAGACEITPSEP